MDNRNTPNWEKHKNQDPQQNEGRGTKEEVNTQRPDNRLKDGTNDLQSGDQDGNSGQTNEHSSDTSNSSKTGS